MRVAIVGTGAIAQNHLVGYRASGADVVAICDVDPATLAARQKAWEVDAGYTDFREMFAEVDLDAVSICTPNSTHHPVTLAAAAAGCHVLCEKPVSMSLAEADQMITACSSAGVVFQVGHHMRSWAAANKARELIEGGAIGDITYARFRQAHDWAGAAKVRGVFGSKELSGGGTLLDNGCHLFDLARYLCGDVIDVFARMATRKFTIEVEDTAISSLGFASGAIGQVEVAWTGTGWQEAFWVFGTEGSLECDNRAGGPNVLVHRSRQAPAQTWAGTDVTTYDLQGGASHTQHVANFLAAIAGTREVVCTGADGREAVRLVLASYESAAAGYPVAL